MNNRKHYTTAEKERKAFATALIAILAVFVVWAVLTLCGVFEKPTWEPDVSYPMANANVGWNQTFYAGGWSEGT